MTFPLPLINVVNPSNKNLIFGSVAAAVLGALLIVMLILAYRNRDRMKEVVKSFLKLEIRTAAELLIDAWDIYGALLACLCLQLFWKRRNSRAGDSFTFKTMLGMRQRDWVQNLLVPWVIFFSLASVASAFSILSKLQFFGANIVKRMRRKRQSGDAAVDEELYQNDFNTRKIYVYALLQTHSLARAR
jgi:hypothetical protein